MRFITGSILAAAVFLAQTPAMAADPVQVTQLAQANKGALVNCRIESNGRVEFNSKCRFKQGGTDEGPGSFSLSDRTGQGLLYAEVMVVTVSVVSPGVAQVFGLTRHGINSRWGTARRSTRNRACWDGADFRICAWK